MWDCNAHIHSSESNCKLHVAVRSIGHCVTAVAVYVCATISLTDVFFSLFFIFSLWLKSLQLDLGDRNEWVCVCTRTRLTVLTFCHKVKLMLNGINVIPLRILFGALLQCRLELITSHILRYRNAPCCTSTLQRIGLRFKVRFMVSCIFSLFTSFDWAIHIVCTHTKHKQQQTHVVDSYMIAKQFPV